VRRVIALSKVLLLQTDSERAGPGVGAAIELLLLPLLLLLLLLLLHQRGALAKQCKRVCPKLRPEAVRIRLLVPGL
jgi:hypothetical protein